MKRTIILLAALTMSLSVTAQPKFNRNKTVKEAEVNPAIEQVVSGQGINETIIKHKGFTVSYNDILQMPNWVSWSITQTEAKTEAIADNNKYMRDPSFKGDQASAKDMYDDRYCAAQMAPAEDMYLNETELRETYYTTNLCPQDKVLNAEAWYELEQKCRYWAAQYGTLYVVTGPMFTIGNRRMKESGIMVPDAFFKVLLQKRKGQWVSVAFIIPNTARSVLDTGMFPVFAVEAITGYRFFAGLPDDVRGALIGGFDSNDWTIATWKNMKGGK